ncbi:hypothetical protein F511_38115 [Dorcoceras hygrometricum]|uniref:Uncharacterized protein n=1 Tax=Dorcoceras hygrometricum TaxID=472368 RepID=A0A2Z7CXK3_9LAMI|nr:hypothetical protein F511_38115 [Dorcoceras hygrometricum]
MFRGNSDSCVSATVEILTIKKTVLLTSFHLIVFKGNRSAYTVVEKKTPKAKKKTSSADETPVDIFAEIATTKKRSATEADAPIISKKRRTRKSKTSVSHVNLDIVQVAPDVEPLQIVDPTHVVAAVPLLCSIENFERGDCTDEADIIIAKVLEETLELWVSATEREGQGVDEAMFEEDFARWLDDFVARHNEPEFVDTKIDTQAEGSINYVVDKEMNISVDHCWATCCWVAGMTAQTGKVAPPEPWDGYLEPLES